MSSLVIGINNPLKISTVLVVLIVTTEYASFTVLEKEPSQKKRIGYI